MTDRIEGEREKFEEWAKNVAGYDVKLSATMDGVYHYLSTQRSWQGWLARAQAEVVGLGELESLRDEIRAQASLKDHYADWEETERLFSALIAKAKTAGDR